CGLALRGVGSDETPRARRGWWKSCSVCICSARAATFRAIFLTWPRERFGAYSAMRFSNPVVDMGCLLGFLRRRTNGRLFLVPRCRFWSVPPGRWVKHRTVRRWRQAGEAKNLDRYRPVTLRRQENPPTCTDADQGVLDHFDAAAAMRCRESSDRAA